MHKLLIAALALLVTGCAANLKIIDRQNGNTYTGTTGSTWNNSGEVSAVVEGEQYQGEWVYSSVGGGYTLGSAFGSAYGSGGYATGSATGTAISVPTSGNGLVTMQGSQGGYMRCVFNFNSMSDTGLGECRDKAGKFYDLTIQR